MIRSAWFWVTIVLIAAGLVLTALLGVLGWVALALAAAIAVVDGILLYSSYAIPRAEAPDLPPLGPTPTTEQLPLIYDCDLTIGRAFRDVGDGLALLYLLGHPAIDVRAITTTYGNGSVGMTTRAARQMIRQLTLEGLDVYEGAAGPLADPWENAAARHLVASANAHPSEMVILASGAMTNLKHAVALDPNFFTKVRSLYLVGGVVGPVVWNERRLSERNFSLDPEAAYQAIRADCPTTITVGEAGLSAVFRGSQFASLERLDDPVSRWIVRRTRLWFGLMRLWFRDDGFALWESVAATAMTDPGLMRFERVYLPTTVDDLRTGRLVTERDSVGPVRLVRGVEDYEGFVSMQLAAWRRLGRTVERRRRSGE